MMMMLVLLVMLCVGGRTGLVVSEWQWCSDDASGQCSATEFSSVVQRRSCCHWCLANVIIICYLPIISYVSAGNSSLNQSFSVQITDIILVDHVMEEHRETSVLWALSLQVKSSQVAFNAVCLAVIGTQITAIRSHSCLYFLKNQQNSWGIINFCM